MLSEVYAQRPIRERNRLKSTSKPEDGDTASDRIRMRQHAIRQVTVCMNEQNDPEGRGD